MVRSAKQGYREHVNLRACPNCGAPLPVGLPGAVESCRFCGVEGRAREATAPRNEGPSPGAESFVVDEAAIGKLCSNYLDHVRAYTRKAKVRDPATGLDSEPDERLMRAVEDKIDIPDRRKDDFRREIMTYVEALAVAGKTFDSHTNERIRRALELKLFEDQRDSRGSARHS